MHVNPENPTPVRSPPHEEQPGRGAQDDQLPFQIPPQIEQAQHAFTRDLAQLLRERPGQWVAYAGEQRIGFAKTQMELYQECLRQGFQQDDFLIRSIEPEAGELSFGLRPVGSQARTMQVPKR